MDNIKKAEDLNTRVLAMLDRVKAEKRSLTNAEAGQVKTMQADIDNLLEGHEMGRKAHNIDRLMNDPVMDGTPLIAVGKTPKDNPVRSKKYRDVFNVSNLSNNGFKDSTELYTSVISNRLDSRLMQNSGANMTVPSEGGFAVPEEHAGILWDRALETEIIRPRASVWPMKTDTRKVGVFVSTDLSSGIYGFTAVWIAEGGTNSVQTPELRSLEFKTNKLAIFTSATREQMEDAPNFGDDLDMALIAGMGYKMDYGFFNGNGAGQPLGFLNADCTIEIAGEDGQAEGTITYENIVNMYSRMLPNAHLGAEWYIHPTCIPNLMTMGLIVGAGAVPVPLLKETNGGAFSMLGHDVVVTSKVPALGNAGCISYANLQYYGIGLRREIILDKSPAPEWTEDKMSFRSILRVDGRPILDEPVTLEDGSNTVSPFVTLAAIE